MCSIVESHRESASEHATGYAVDLQDSGIGVLLHCHCVVAVDGSDAEQRYQIEQGEGSRRMLLKSLHRVRWRLKRSGEGAVPTRTLILAGHSCIALT